MGIGTPTEFFACDLHIPRCQPEREWILDLCQVLWRHGMTFLQSHTFVGTWEEQLHHALPLQEYAQKSLSDEINEVVADGFGSLICYDRNVEFDVSIDTDLRADMMFHPFSDEQQAIREKSSFGKLTMYVRYPVINDEDRLPPLPVGQVPFAAYLIPPYQQIHAAMLYWLNILCTELQPAFALGYYATNSYFVEEANFRPGFDLATITALEQQQFPPLHDWLTSVYALYIPEPLLHAPQAEEWLSSPGMWRRRLPNNAWLAYSLPETLDEVRIRDLCTACDTILTQRDRAQLPLARIYLQRAQEIAATIQRENYPFRRLLSQLTYMEEHPEMFR